TDHLSAKPHILRTTVPNATSSHPAPHSFPTRRSSDLVRPGGVCASADRRRRGGAGARHRPAGAASVLDRVLQSVLCDGRTWGGRSEEHTSELQSRFDLVCRLLLEKKK